MRILNPCDQVHMKHLQNEVDTTSKKRQYANHASSLGDSCLRRLAMLRLVPELQKRIDARLKALFNLGNYLEKDYKLELHKAGMIIQTFDFTPLWDEFKISGDPDGVRKIQYSCPSCGSEPKDDCNFCYGTGAIDDRAIVEIKTMKEYTFDAIFTAEDFLKKGWTKKYLVQLLTYLWLQETYRFGEFILINKSTGETKSIIVDRDQWLELAEWGIGNAELVEEVLRVNKEKHDSKEPAFEISTKIGNRSVMLEFDYGLNLYLPPKINDPDECGKNWCRFHSACGPDIEYGPEIKLVINPKLLNKLIRRDEVNDAKKEYNDLTASAKLMFNLDETHDKGKWLVTDGENLDNIYLVTASKSKVKADGTRTTTRKYKRITETEYNLEVENE